MSNPDPSQDGYYFIDPADDLMARVTIPIDSNINNMWATSTWPSNNLYNARRQYIGQVVDRDDRKRRIGRLQISTELLKDLLKLPDDCEIQSDSITITIRCDRFKPVGDFEITPTIDYHEVIGYDP